MDRRLGTMFEVSEHVDLASLEAVTVTPRHRRVWGITRRVGAWPRWPLVEDVEADDFVVENDVRQLVLLSRRAREPAVVGISPGLSAQDADGVVGDGVPVDEEL